MKQFDVESIDGCIAGWVAAMIQHGRSRNSNWNCLSNV
ncbi:putative RNase H-like nuclease [Bacillus capparidis]|uniref:RNase H-like nuclease n=1 Tax=Bacillus capparidis TaxID=1840411 RepID=A0ABS4CVC2_9BACI|nr:putative RNase H-like nuclease [Bacillus capparidis]